MTRGIGFSVRYQKCFQVITYSCLRFCLLIYKVHGSICFYKCLSFGYSVSCSKFKIFSIFFEWVLKEKSQSTNDVDYLFIYFFFLLAGRSGTQKYLQFILDFLELCHQLRKKNYWSYDYFNLFMTLEIPMEKLIFLRFQFQSIVIQTKVMFKQL